MKNSFTTAMSAAIVLMTSAALAAPLPAVKCEASKNKAVGAYYACREKALATSILRGESPDYTRCVTKFGDKWDGAEALAESDCPDQSPMSAPVEAYISGQASQAAAIVAGAAMPSCGDGVINAAGEHCDGSALDGYTCASFGFLGTLACSAGCDFNLSGCTTCPAPGVEYGGACWVLGAVAGDCDSACATVGLVYDDRTSIIAGSDGSNANCIAVLDVVGAVGDMLDNAGGPCTDALGCGVIPEFFSRARCGSPATTSTAFGPGIQRACACE